MLLNLHSISLLKEQEFLQKASYTGDMSGTMVGESPDFLSDNVNLPIVRTMSAGYRQFDSNYIQLKSHTSPCVLVNPPHSPTITY